jgi:hypothetical protein
MLTPLLQILATAPLIGVAAVFFVTWAIRRRPGRLRPAWLLGFGTLLVAADATEPLPWLDAGTAAPAHHTLDVGMGGGSYQTCGGPRTYGDVGAMYRYETPISSQTSVAISAGAYGGSDGGEYNGAGRLSLGLEHRWIGGGLGVVAGALHRESPLGTPVLPTASLRLGPRDKIWIEGSFLDTSPAPLPGVGFTVGAGVAFPRLGNQWEPLAIRGGMSLQGAWLAPSFPVGENATLEVVGAYGDRSTWGATVRIRLRAPG